MADAYFGGMGSLQSEPLMAHTLGGDSYPVTADTEGRIVVEPFNDMLSTDDDYIKRLVREELVRQGVLRTEQLVQPDAETTPIKRAEAISDDNDS